MSYKQWAKRVQRYMSHVERLFSPDLFVVGGGVSKEAEKWVPLLNLTRPGEAGPAAQQRRYRRRGGRGRRASEPSSSDPQRARWVAAHDRAVQCIVRALRTYWTRVLRRPTDGELTRSSSPHRGSVAQVVVLTHDVAKGRSWPPAHLPQLFRRFGAQGRSRTRRRPSGWPRHQAQEGADREEVGRGGKAAREEGDEHRGGRAGRASRADRVAADGGPAAGRRRDAEAGRCDTRADASRSLEESPNCRGGRRRDGGRAKPAEAPRTRRSSPGTTRRSPRRCVRPAKTPR